MMRPMLLGKIHRATGDDPGQVPGGYGVHPSGLPFADVRG